MRRLASIAGFAFLLGLCSCGGSSGSIPVVPPTPPPQFNIASGDWSFSLLGTGSPPPLLFGGGFLAQNGAAVSGTVHLIGSSCLDGFVDDLVVTGTASGNTLTFSTAPLRGQILSLSLRPTAGPSGSVISLEGSGSLTGSCGLSFSASASLVPPMNGVFKAAFDSGMTGNLSANLSQSGADAHGYFHVSGDLSLSGSPCFASATITDSIGFGGAVVLTLNTDTADQARLIAVHAVVATVADELIATLVMESGACGSQVGSIILKKQ